MMRQLIKSVILGSVLLGSIGLGMAGVQASYSPSISGMIVAQSTAEAISTTSSTPEATSAAPFSEVLGTVRGVVTNGTADGSVPTGLPIKLHVLSEVADIQQFETTTNAMGQFSFSNVPIAADKAYGITATYQQHVYASDAYSGDPSQGIVEIPLEIFETTSNPQVLMLTRFMMQMMTTTDGLQVVHVMTLTNNTDRAFITDQKVDERRFVSVTIPMPTSAEPISVEDEALRYVVSADGKQFYDTLPVLPEQEHRVHVVYTVPYTGNLVLFDGRLPYQIAADIQVLIPENGIEPTLTVNGGKLQFMGVQTMPSGKFRLYSIQVNTSSGAQLRFELNGSAQNTSFVSQENMAALALTVGGVLLMVVGLVLILRNRRRVVSSADTQRQEVLEELAFYEQQHRQRAIGEEEYHAKRTALQAELDAQLPSGTKE